MVAPLLIDRTRLERSYGALDVAGFADNDPADVVDALQEASDLAWGALRKGYAEDDIVTLCANDRAVQGAIASIAADVLARRRKEFRLPDGRTMYAHDRKLGEAYLESVADGHARSVAEASATAGLSPTRLLGNRVRPAKVSVLKGGF